jgi:hypothetical protein
MFYLSRWQWQDLNPESLGLCVGCSTTELLEHNQVLKLQTNSVELQQIQMNETFFPVHNLVARFKPMILGFFVECSTTELMGHNQGLKVCNDGSESQELRVKLFCHFNSPCDGNEHSIKGLVQLGFLEHSSD